jgi:hypothetical protein
MIRVSGIVNVSTSYPFLMVSFPDTVKAGTYNLTNNSAYQVNYAVSANNNDYYSSQHTTANAGTLVITKHDLTAKTVTGTFFSTVTNITSTSTLSITGGSFTAIYK